jgi:hypothetical protein
MILTDLHWLKGLAVQSQASIAAHVSVNNLLLTRITILALISTQKQMGLQFEHTKRQFYWLLFTWHVHISRFRSRSCIYYFSYIFH